MESFILLALLAILGLVIVPIACWLVAMCSICGHTSAEFTRIGHNKVVWLAANFFLGPLGSFLYLTTAWPAFKQQREALNTFTPTPPHPTWTYPYPLGPIEERPVKDGPTNAYFPEFDEGYRPKT